MKLLIMCEGPNELKIINILLENQMASLKRRLSFLYWSSKKNVKNFFTTRLISRS